MIRDCICGTKPTEQKLLVVGFGYVPYFLCEKCGAAGAPALATPMARQSWNATIKSKSSIITRASKRQMAKGAKK